MRYVGSNPTHLKGKEREKKKMKKRIEVGLKGESEHMWTRWEEKEEGKRRKERKEGYERTYKGRDRGRIERRGPSGGTKKRDEKNGEIL